MRSNYNTIKKIDIKGGLLMQEFYQKNKQAFQNCLFLLLAILFCFLFFKYLFPIFLPFLIGWLCSLLFNPLADRMERYHIPRGISALWGILFLFALLGGLGFWSGNSIFHRLQAITENLPYYTDRLETNLAAFWHRFDVLLEKLPPQLQTAAEGFQKDFSGILLSLVKSGGSGFSALPDFFIGFFVAILSAYFLTKDRDAVSHAYQTHIQPLLGTSVHTTRQELKASVWGYIKTQFILMGITFAITLTALLLLGSPYPVVLSICIAVIDALPFFGSGFFLWPGAVIHLLAGNTALAVGYLALYGIIQVMRQILQPKILGTQIGLHPLLTLFSMYFGFCCVGVFGLILGPIIAVILKAFFKLRNT